MNRDEIRELAAQLFQGASISNGTGAMVIDLGYEKTCRRLAEAAFIAAETFAKVARERPETKTSQEVSHG